MDKPTFNFVEPQKLAAVRELLQTKLGLHHSMLQLQPTRYPEKAMLAIVTPTGVRIGVIDLSFYDDSWHFGGTSSLLPDMWTELCDIGRRPNFIEYTDPRIKT